MRVRDLGVVQLQNAGRTVELPGRRVATALTVLLVDPGRPVTADVLVEALWGDGPFPRSTAALDTVIWRLRAALEPGRPARRPSTILRSVAGGFRLDLPPEAVDSWVLDAATDRVRRAIAGQDDRDGVLQQIGDALGRWRGEPFSGIDVADVSGRIAARRAALGQARLVLWERQAQLLLLTGRDDAVVRSLPDVLQDHPYAEKLWGYWILAQYRTGRATAALTAHRQLRSRLADDLGLDPGPELAELEQRILRHDPTLLDGDPAGSAHRPDAVAVGSGARRPADRPAVPLRTDSLVGRDGDLVQLDRLLISSDVVSVVGPVGAGKTRLAIAAAAMVAERFPDGVHLIDFSDVTSPHLVPDRVLAGLGLDAGPDVAIRSQVTAYLRGRAILLLLDNCEQIVDGVADLVQAIRDGGFAGRVLVTSRRPLDMDGERVHHLRPLPVPPADESQIAALAENPAVRLFLDRMTPGAEPGWSAVRRWSAAGPGVRPADVVAVCRATDGLPLALELAAARARIFTMPEVAAIVLEHPLGLGSTARSRARPGEGRSLRSSIEASHRLLTVDQQVLHRRLSVLAGPATVAAIAATCADRLTPAQVADAVFALVDHSMLEREPSADPGVSCFRQLVPLRAHAAEQLAVAGEIDAARRGVRDFVLTLVRSGPVLGGTGQRAWYTRLDAHRRLVVETLVSALAEQPTDETLETTARLTVYWLDRLANADGLRIVDDAAAAVARRSAADPVDPWVDTVVGAARVCLAAANQHVAEVADEIDRLMGRLAAAGADGRAEPAAWWLVQVSVCCWVGDDYARAAQARARAEVICAAIDDPRLRIALTGLSAADLLVCDPAAGEVAGAAVMAAADAADDDWGRLLGAMVLSVAARFRHDGASGLGWSAELLRVQQRLGVRNIADTLETRGNHHATTGDPAAAVRCYGAAAEQNTRNGRAFPRHPGTAELLAAVREQLSIDAFDRAWAAGCRVAVDDPAAADL